MSQCLIVRSESVNSVFTCCARCLFSVPGPQGLSVAASGVSSTADGVAVCSTTALRCGIGSYYTEASAASLFKQWACIHAGAVSVHKHSALCHGPGLHRSLHRIRQRFGCWRCKLSLQGCWRCKLSLLAAVWRLWQHCCLCSWDGAFGLCLTSSQPLDGLPAC
jgi:hypothetical protein